MKYFCVAVFVFCWLMNHTAFADSTSIHKSISQHVAGRTGAKQSAQTQYDRSPAKTRPFAVGKTGSSGLNGTESKKNNAVINEITMHRQHKYE